MAAYQIDELSRDYLNVEIEPPDITRFAAGNRGVPYAWTFDGLAPGPRVVVLGAMHGNEIAGAAILESLLDNGIQPLIGQLSLIFGNPAAYHAFDPSRPYLGRFIDVDINRVWGRELLDDTDDRAEVQRARELLPIISAADYLLDLHTMQGVGAPVALLTRKPATIEFVSGMQSVPFVLSGAMHQADRVRLRDYGRFGDPALPAVAIQVEAGQHWQSSSIATGLKIVRDFLACAGLIDRKGPRQAIGQKQLTIVETVLPEAPFSFVADFASGTYFPERGTLVGLSGPDRTEIRTPVDNCYMIMPVHFRQAGGSCCRFAVEA